MGWFAYERTNCLLKESVALLSKASEVNKSEEKDTLNSLGSKESWTTLLLV